MDECACGNLDYHLLRDAELTYWKAVSWLADSAIRAMESDPSEDYVPPETVIKGRRFQEMTDLLRGLPWFDRMQDGMKTQPGEGVPNLGTLVTEFVGVAQHAEYWAGALGLARDAARAMDTGASEEPEVLPDEVVQLTSSTQWRDWMRLRENGGVAL